MERYIDAQNGGPGQGLVPHRHQPRPGSPGHQRRQARRGDGHRDLGAVRLHREARRARPEVHRRLASTGSSTRCARWASPRWSWSTSSTTPSPASRATPARPATWSTAPTPSRPARPGGCRPASPTTPRCTTRTRTTRCRSDSADIPAQDALFGAVVKVSGRRRCRRCPLYPAQHHCNTLGLTGLGAHTIRGMAKRHMIFDPDHMSVKARKAALDLVDALGLQRSRVQPLLVDPGRLPADPRREGLHRAVRRRQHRLRREVEAAPDLGQPRAPTGASASAPTSTASARRATRGRTPPRNHPVTYPFTTLGGVTVDQQVSGQRVYDINKDGVAHYGLYPDWIQDLRMLAGNDIVEGHVPRPRGLPADVGAGVRGEVQRLHQPGLAPHPSAIRSRCAGA